MCVCVCVCMTGECVCECSRIKQSNPCRIHDFNACTSIDKDPSLCLFSSCCVCVSACVWVSVWILEAERRLKLGIRNSPHTTQNASGLIPGSWKTSGDCFSKIALMNHASADFICHHLWARATFNETKTQQTIRYTKQHLRINTHLDGLRVATDAHTHTHIMQMHTHGRTRARLTHTHTHTHTLSVSIELPVSHFLH